MYRSSPTGYNHRQPTRPEKPINPIYRSRNMPDRKFTSWVQGSSMQIEYPNRVTAVRHTGPCVRIEGTAGQNTWVHLPVPTPTVADGTPIRVGAGLVSFRSKDRATVHEVIVYDGEKRNADHTGLE